MKSYTDSPPAPLQVLLSLPLDIARDQVAAGTEVKVVVLFDSKLRAKEEMTPIGRDRTKRDSPRIQTDEFSYVFSKTVDYEMGFFESFGRRFA